MVGTGCMKTFDGLKYELNWSLHTFRSKHLCHLFIDFLNCKRFVNSPDTIVLFCRRLTEFCKASLVDVVNQFPHTSFLQKSNSSTKNAELFQSRHIDAVIVGKTDLRRTTNHHDFLGMQTVEYLEDAFLQSCSTNNRIIDDNKVILVGT